MDNQETNQTTGRFHIGQEIYAVATVINGRNTIKTTLGTVHGDQPVLHFKKLIVNEHYNVSDQWAYRESRVHDGYILTDGEDFYFNQYPHASYGQLNDSRDYLFKKQPCIDATSEQYQEMYADQVNNPVFWNSVTKVYDDLIECCAVYEKGSGAYAEVMNAMGRLLHAFEKAFPGKTLKEVTTAIIGGESIRSEVTDK